MIKIHSFIEFWREIERLQKQDDEMLFFRGVSDASYDLKPGICFETNVNESDAYRDIVLDFPEEFADKKHLSNLVKMQHYGLNTRLMDVSTNPVISLFFASEQKNNIADGSVVALKCKKDKVLRYNSDKALMLSCLPLFSNKDKNEIKNFCERHPGKICDQDIVHNDVMQRFLHEIRGEYPAFETAIIGQDLLDSFFVMPNRDNERMKIQSGAFVIFGLDIARGQDMLSRLVVENIIVDKSAKDDILKSLYIMNISNNTIYSGMERTALYLRSKKLAWKGIGE